LFRSHALACPARGAGGWDTEADAAVRIRGRRGGEDPADRRLRAELSSAALDRGGRWPLVGGHHGDDGRRGRRSPDRCCPAWRWRLEWLVAAGYRDWRRDRGTAGAGRHIGAARVAHAPLDAEAVNRERRA